MANIFDELCAIASGYPPTADAFVQRCRDACAREYPDYLRGNRWPGIEARIRRAHPSFVRERHLSALLSDAGVACTRSVAVDMHHGADLVIVHGAYALRLATFIATAEGNRQWARKSQALVADAIVIGLPLETKHCAEIGSYWLYTPDHVGLIIANLPDIVRSGPGLYMLSTETSTQVQGFAETAPELYAF